MAYFPHLACRSASSSDSFKGPGIDKGHAPLNSMLCNVSFRTMKWVSRNGCDALSRLAKMLDSIA